MRSFRLTLSILCAVAFLACNAGVAAPPADSATAAKVPVTEDEKTIYALGLMLSKNLMAFDLTPEEVALVQQALADSMTGKTPAVKIDQYETKVRELAQSRGAKRAEKEKAAGKAYLDTAAAKPGATKTASGLVYQETLAGTGASPVATDTVKVHYRGTLLDGSEFDSSIARGEPVEFGLGRVIPCWTEGLQKMKVGGKATLVCPSDLAYGDRGRPSIPPGATLVFEIELLDIVKPAAPAANQ